MTAFEEMAVGNSPEQTQTQFCVYNDIFAGKGNGGGNNGMKFEIKLICYRSKRKEKMDSYQRQKRHTK